jgi:hypothetical protein
MWTESQLYPVAEWSLVRAHFGRQEKEYSCAAAAVRHGLLLGGVHYPEQVLANWMDVTPWGTDHLRIKRFLHAQNTFRATPWVRRSSEPSAAFFARLGKALVEGAFALACIGEGGNDHWVCLGAWREARLWWLNSHLDYGPLFSGHTAEAFDALEWGDEVILVEPRRWAERFQEWAPLRGALLSAHDVSVFGLSGAVPPLPLDPPCTPRTLLPEPSRAPGSGGPCATPCAS